MDFSKKDLSLGFKIRLAQLPTCPPKFQHGILVLNQCQVIRRMDQFKEPELLRGLIWDYPYVLGDEVIFHALSIVAEGFKKEPAQTFWHCGVVVNASVDDSPGSMVNFAFTGYRIHGFLQKRGAKFFLNFKLECGTPWANGNSVILWRLEFELFKQA